MKALTAIIKKQFGSILHQDHKRGLDHMPTIVHKLIFKINGL